jgi:phospholipase C
MKIKAKLSIAAPILILAVMLTSSVVAVPEIDSRTATPIQHVVVIFQENVSYDHYFATYPIAANPAGEPQFTAAAGTPTPNGLSGSLLTSNPNLANPFRLDRSQAITCDNNHDYTPEQQAVHGGLMDKFVQYLSPSGASCTPNLPMGYYDGNTVTALWEYGQNFAMSDNSFGTTFGPSTPGALNLVSGQTNGATPASIPDSVAGGTVIGDPDPTYDDCSGSGTVAMTTGLNVGDLLNTAGVTWGFFQGGFAPTSYTSTGKAVCHSTHVNVGGATVTDYSPHHEPFQYYQSTANPRHLPPTSPSMIGKTDQANHQYDLSNFWTAADASNLPAVSFLKAPKYQDGHAGYSDPLDEQTFLVQTINHLQQLPSWKSTAVIIAYDDSDGWYDHVMAPIVSQSSDPTYDALLGSGLCGTTPAGAPSDRCGYGPRLPLLIVSPYSKQNYVDGTVTDQTSILKFIEYNWNLPSIGPQSFDQKAGTLLNMFDFNHVHGAYRLFLNPATGLPTPQDNQGD